MFCSKYRVNKKIPGAGKRVALATMRMIFFAMLFSGAILSQLSGQQSEPNAKLMAAIAAGNIKEVEEAATDKVALNKPASDGGLPLLFAAERNFAEAVALLLKKGADANAIDADGKTALMLCGLDMYHIRKTGGGRTAPGLKEEMKKDKKALEKRQKAAGKVVELLIKAGADIQRADKEGATALHHAVRRDDLIVVKLLVAAGAKADARNKQGQSALGLLSQGLGTPSKDTAEIRKILKKAGAEN